ncbi:hypothetical protein [Clostridium hydrogenum]|uniref:hypothetical protein n=1 Tax=Clostridium hydrogenum TaxID=2855764 RepID=UPI001F1E22AC|nr:hypothetical protein [Clostridium hydrogenum]
MKKNKLTLFMLIPTLMVGLSTNFVKADDISNSPYNINFQIGTNASKMRFNWFSLYNNGSELEIAKSSYVK